MERCLFEPNYEYSLFRPVDTGTHFLGWNELEVCSSVSISLGSKQLFLHWDFTIPYDLMKTQKPLPKCANRGSPTEVYNAIEVKMLNKLFMIEFEILRKADLFGNAKNRMVIILPGVVEL